jgi:AhpD family alkylhydroperoxidase
MFVLKEVEELFNNVTKVVNSPNNLDGKTKALVALACSVMADCVPCIKYYYKNAIYAGATKEEIAEALAISMSVSAGSKKAKYSSVIDDMESASHLLQPNA